MYSDEQYLKKVESGEIDSAHFVPTPYSNLYILIETENVEHKYKDEDGDWVYKTEAVVKRKAFISFDGTKASFFVNNWFTDIDSFVNVYYSIVRLGNLCNLLLPTGEYLFNHWYNSIVSKGNSLLFCSLIPQSTNPCYLGANQQKQNTSFDIYDKKGKLLLRDIILESDFQEGYAVISHEHKKNLLNENGNTLLSEWVDDVSLFHKQYAYIKVEDNWGLVNKNGVIVLSPGFTSISPIECKVSCGASSFHPIAKVGGDKGFNVLISKKTDELLLGFTEPVDDLIFIANHTCIAKKNDKWRFYEFGNYEHYTESQKVEPFDSVDYSLIHTGWTYYWKICKKGEYNLLDDDGRTILKEWYTSLEVYDNVVLVSKIRTSIEPSLISDSVDVDAKKVYNLISISNNEYLLKNWFGCIKVYMHDGFPVVNIKPQICTGYNGNVIDSSIKYSAYKDVYGRDTDKRVVSFIEGKCNVYIDGVFWSEWYDQIAFLNGKLFDHGFAKVYKDSKCNLIDASGKLELSEWVDDIVSIHPCSQPSYLSYDIRGAIQVKKEGKTNFVFCGRYLFDQWFTAIGRVIDKGFYRVQQGGDTGLYSPQKGLIGGKCFHKIEILEHNLFFCHDNTMGHILNAEGQIVSSGEFVMVRPFKNGYAVIRTSEDRYKGKYNFIDVNGNIVSDIWFDTGYGHDDIYNEPPEFLIVRHDGKMNVLNSEKKLLFRTWYKSISGIDNNWQVSLLENDVESFYFIDNKENRLTKDSFTEVYDLKNLEKGYHVVRTSSGYNIVDDRYNYTLNKWYKNSIRDHDDLISVEIKYNKYVFISKKGQLISEACGSISESFYETVEGKYQRFYILELSDRTDHFESFELICNSDGTPLFSHLINDSTLRCSGIRLLSIPNKDKHLVIDKRYPGESKAESRKTIVSFSGKVVLQNPIDSIGEFDEDGYALVKRDDKYNLMTSEFGFVLPLWFDNLGFEYKSKKTEYSEYWDDEAERVAYNEYEVDVVKRNTSFINDALKVELSSSFNYINKEGKFLFKKWYDSAVCLNENCYKVSLNGKWNFLDNTGKELSNKWFDSIKRCKNAYDRKIYACCRDSLYYLLFIEGNRVILSNIGCDQVFNYSKSEGFYSVRLKEKKNFINNKGELVLPDWYDDILLFDNYPVSRIVVQRKNTFNIYDCTQRKFISKKWFDLIIKSAVGLFDNNGLCCIKTKDGFNYINEEGKILSAHHFDAVYGFINGFSGVALNNKRNFINLEGEFVSSEWYDEISAYTRYGIAMIKNDNGFNIIDKNGCVLIDKSLGFVNSIDLKDETYCIAHCSNGSSCDTDVYFDYATRTTYQNEQAFNASRKSIIVDTSKENKVVSSKETNKPLYVIKSSSCGYSIVEFGDAVNVLTPDNKLLLDKWQSQSDIYLINGVVLYQDRNSGWIIVN